jgi:DNA-3-methyladenine glycosylase II
MEDEEIVQALIPVKGVGRWTVEMLLIFAMNRPDVWPVDDLGVRRGWQLAYGLKEMPGRNELMGLGERLRPWRSVGAWYLWRAVEREVRSQKSEVGRKINTKTR